VSDNDIFFVRSKKRSPAFFGDDAAFIDPRDELIDGKYIKVTVNIERSKDRIQREFSRVLDEELKHYQPDQVPLESKEDRARAFALWKLAKEGHSVKTTAYKLNLSEKTVKRQHKTAWETIYPVRAYPGWPAKPKTAEYTKSNISPCDICSSTTRAEKCLKTNRPCDEAEKFYEQDKDINFLLRDRYQYQKYRRDQCNLSKKNDTMIKPLLTSDELAAAINLPRHWIYEQSRISKKTGFPVEKYGKYLRFDLAAVREWARNNKGN
jgi:hypothetical protein